MQDYWFDQFAGKAGKLHLSWRVDDDVQPFDCDRVLVYRELEQETIIPCDQSHHDTDQGTVTVTLDLDQHHLHPDQLYLYCVSLLHLGQVIPGCSGPVLASLAPRSQTPRVRITSLHGNVSLTHNMSVSVVTRVPGEQVEQCQVMISVSVPGESPVSVETFRCDCSTGHEMEEEEEVTTDHLCHVEATVSDLPAHTYYNVCADLQSSGGDLQRSGGDLSSSGVVDRQCMILHTSTVVRYENR